MLAKSIRMGSQGLAHKKPNTSMLSDAVLEHGTQCRNGVCVPSIHSLWFRYGWHCLLPFITAYLLGGLIRMHSLRVVSSEVQIPVCNDAVSL